jgi:hypothetical protein
MIWVIRRCKDIVIARNTLRSKCFHPFWKSWCHARRSRRVSGFWIPSVKRFEMIRKVTYLSDALVSMLKTMLYKVSQMAYGNAQHLPIMPFSTLVVRLGCNPLGAARSRPTPSNHWPSGVTATLCNWMRPMWYESRTLRCVQLTFRWHQVI